MNEQEKNCYLAKFRKPNGRPTAQHFYGDSAEEVWDVLEEKGCEVISVYERKLYIRTIPAKRERVEG